MSVVTAPTLRPAVHGDSWESHWFGIVVANSAPDLRVWNIRAQVRAGAAVDPLFSWFVPLGITTDTGVELTGTTWRLRDGSQIDVPALQLRLRARDWTNQPTRWSGYLEVELTRGPLHDPDDRRTIVRRRPFRIVPDLVP